MIPKFGSVALVPLVALAALLFLGFAGFGLGNPVEQAVAEPFPAEGKSSMNAPSGARVFHLYDPQTGCISASEGEALVVVTCEGEAAGLLESSEIRVTIRADPDFDLWSCLRSRSFQLSEQRFGNWCILN